MATVAHQVHSSNRNRTNGKQGPTSTLNQGVEKIVKGISKKKSKGSTND
jgi:hypothetical protein